MDVNSIFEILSHYIHQIIILYPLYILQFYLSILPLLIKLEHNILSGPVGKQHTFPYLVSLYVLYHLQGFYKIIPEHGKSVNHLFFHDLFLTPLLRTLLCTRMSSPVSQHIWVSLTEMPCMFLKTVMRPKAIKFNRLEL